MMGFAPAGEGDSGGGVVGVAAAADEAGIADAAGGFREGAPGRGSGGEVAVDVEGDGSYGVVRVLVGFAGEGGVDAALKFGLMEGHKPVAFAGHDEIGVVAEGHAMLAGEAFGTGRDEVDVGALLEDEAGGLDGVAEALDAGYATSAEGRAFHDEGVELDASIAGEEGAPAGVEGVVVFHDGDGGFDGFGGWGSFVEEGAASAEGVGDAVFVGGDSVVGHGPGSAVDDKGGVRVDAHQHDGYLLVRNRHLYQFTRDQAMVKGLLCDMDGTLVDSNGLHAESWQRCLEKYGIHVTVGEVQRQIGKGGDQMLPMFLDKGRIAEIGEELKECKSKLFEAEYLDKVKPFPQARELMEAIADKGIRIAMASSAAAEELDRYLEIVGIAGLVDKKTSSDDAEESKPEPDIFLAALGKLGLGPGEVMALGDTPWDAQAAGRAGVKTIGVECGGWLEEDLRKAGCAEVYRDPADLLGRLKGSGLM